MIKKDRDLTDNSKNISLTSKISHDMLHTVAEALSGYLASTGAYSVNARNIGIPIDAFMISTGLFCYEPRVILYGNDRIKMQEYSNVTKEHVAIRRPDTVVASYVNYKGERVVRDLEGIEARYFQHELDNLKGVDWRTRATHGARIESIKRMLH